MHTAPAIHMVSSDAMSLHQQAVGFVMQPASEDVELRGEGDSVELLLGASALWKNYRGTLYCPWGPLWRPWCARAAPLSGFTLERAKVASFF